MTPAPGEPAGCTHLVVPSGALSIVHPLPAGAGQVLPPPFFPRRNGEAEAQEGHAVCAVPWASQGQLSQT